ncbi:MAG: hypothetical protein NTY96_12815 [Bacteroidetes bacterium]|nr:hypothetical protein [Bacteroidota bacterium]
MRFRSGIPLFLLVLFPFFAISQKPEIRTVEGESQVEFPDIRSRHDVEKEALEKASITALEKAFGTVVIRGNSTYMKNLNTGKETKTSVVFNSIANTYVKGEVIDAFDQNFEEVQGLATIDGKKKAIRELKCTATFKVRELTDDVPDFEAIPLQCPDLGCNTTSFKYKGSLFLYFKSPYDGYLAVYLDNGTTAQCLLPYTRMSETFENGVPLKGGKEYIFFSRQPAFSYFDNTVFVDEYELSAEDSQEQNRLFVIFSRSAIASPGLQTGLDDKLLSPDEKARQYKVPKSLYSEDFQKWLIRNRTHKSDLRVMPIDITIQK